jgi:hypothetical protein
VFKSEVVLRTSLARPESHSEFKFGVRHGVRDDASMGMANTDDTWTRSWPKPTDILQADCKKNFQPKYNCVYKLRTNKKLKQKKIKTKFTPFFLSKPPRII